jgi:hypothetical protein
VIIVREMHYVNDINLVPKMVQIIKVQRYVILEAAFTIALLGVLLYKYLFTVCEISGRPIDNVYVKSSWSISNLQNLYIMYIEVYVK